MLLAARAAARALAPDTSMALPLVGEEGRVTGGGGGTAEAGRQWVSTFDTGTGVTGGASVGPTLH